MELPAKEALDAVDRLHGMEWFWKRTLWEIKYQPVSWAVCTLIVLGLFLAAAVLIVYWTSPRKTIDVKFVHVWHRRKNGD